MGCGATGEDEDLSDGDAAGSDVNDAEEDEDEGEGEDNDEQEEEEEQHQAKVSEIGMQAVRLHANAATHRLKHLLNGRKISFLLY